MIAACVQCGKEFLHASQGRLFYHRGGHLQSHAGGLQSPSASEVEFYWLCDNCATKYTLQLVAAGKVRVVESAGQEADAAEDGKQQLSAGDSCPNCSVLGMSND